jgi:diguanylate cyclase (GGDEF)-like protein
VQDALAAAARCDAARRQIERAAVDPLTRVATRGEIGPRLAAANTGDVVCMLDLDHFKQLNDEHGHAAGDRALEALGALLLQVVRDSDFCGRYGGDEFLVLLVDAPLPVARQRMQDLLSRWTAVPGHGTGLSVGIAAVGSTGAAAAVEAADRALYDAKRRGRGRVRIAEEPEEEQPHDD